MSGKGNILRVYMNHAPATVSVSKRIFFKNHVAKDQRGIRRNTPKALWDKTRSF